MIVILKRRQHIIHCTLCMYTTHYTLHLTFYTVNCTVYTLHSSMHTTLYTGAVYTIPYTVRVLVFSKSSKKFFAFTFTQEADGGRKICLYWFSAKYKTCLLEKQTCLLEKQTCLLEKQTCLLEKQVCLSDYLPVKLVSLSVKSVFN